jgi:precorrin-2 dehydrogenase/sirohydrochlorin ferrochelatase
LLLGLSHAEENRSFLPGQTCQLRKNHLIPLSVKEARLAMIAVALDPVAVAIGVAGRGPAALRRFLALRAGGSQDALLFSDEPAGLEASGQALRHHLPTRTDIAGLRVLWITGLPAEKAAELADLARAERVLVNVEDRPALCDFHSVAEVRRGDLLLTVSTGGASPGLAARIRERLAADFGPEWVDRLALLRRRRNAWRQNGDDVPALTDALIHANGWLA